MHSTSSMFLLLDAAVYELVTAKHSKIIRVKNCEHQLSLWPGGVVSPLPYGYV